MAAFSFDRARAKRAVLATCVVAALTTAGLASARGKHPFADANAASPRFSREAMQRWLDTPRWMQTPLMAATTNLDAFGIASLITVDTCADDLSAHSLRKALEAAQDNDVVDLTHLTCSTITLQNGELRTSNRGIKVFGPPDHRLTIDADSASRVLEAQKVEHLYDIGLANGSVVAAPYVGGCLYAHEDVFLHRVALTGCTVNAEHAASVVSGGAVYSAQSVKAYEATVRNSVVTSAVTPASGGGIGSRTTVVLSGAVASGNRVESNGIVSGGAIIGHDMFLYATEVDGNTAHSFGSDSFGGGLAGTTIHLTEGSTISNNVAQSDLSQAAGGGVFGAHLTLDRSTVTTNAASTSTTVAWPAMGGGIASSGDLAVTYSTIDHNKARCTIVNSTSTCVAFGGGIATSGNASDDVTLMNATISSNSAEAGDNAKAGGIFVDNRKALLAESSTIAFNQSTGTGGGVVGTSAPAAPTTLTNSIVSNNTDKNGRSDIASAISGQQISVRGAHDIIVVASADVDLLVSSRLLDDPQLAQIADNGGATRTHAFAPDSAALDNGTSSGVTFPECDQRGAGFQRTVGGTPDIGAYEAQDPLHGDQVFFDGFNPKGTDDCNF